MIAAPYFDGWFAHLPVVRLDALVEMSGVGDVPAFNPQFQTLSGRGRISWGTSDTRVDWRLAQALQTDTTVDRVEYPGLGHETTPQAIDDILSWLKAN
jgi:hypothetical protein